MKAYKGYTSKPKLKSTFFFFLSILPAFFVLLGLMLVVDFFFSNCILEGMVQVSFGLFLMQLCIS